MPFFTRLALIMKVLIYLHIVPTLIEHFRYHKQPSAKCVAYGCLFLFRLLKLFIKENNWKLWLQTYAYLSIFALGVHISSCAIFRMDVRELMLSVNLQWLIYV